MASLAEGDFNRAMPFLSTNGLVDTKGRRGDEGMSAFISVSEKGRELLRVLSGPGGNRVLIIHGHDDGNRSALKDMLQNRLQLPEPVIMAQQMIPGASLPEKFETLAATVDFAVALLTPDDLGRARDAADLQPRARQNTLIEIGWFWGRLGRDRVLLLVNGALEIPTDLQGLEFFRFDRNVEQVSEKIRDFFNSHRSGAA